MNLKIRRLVLEEAKIQLRMNESLLAMLIGNTPIEDLAKLREGWIEPLEELVKQLEKRESKHAKPT